LAEADTSSNDGSSKNEEIDQRAFSDEENVIGPTTRKAWSEWVKKASGKESSDDDNNNAG
jgi:hypothetical protein